MKKEQVDLANKVVFIEDSKTPTGVAEVPLTDIAVEAFRSQIASGRPWPVALSERCATGPDTRPNSNKTWRHDFAESGSPLLPAL